MVESSIDKIESFVQELVNKVVQEAMNNFDSSIENTTSSSCYFPACPASRQSNVRKNRSFSLRVASQVNERMKKSFPCEGNLDDATRFQLANPRSLEGNSTFDVDQRASEEIRKIVQGLQGMQIGDVSPVEPILQISSLESQVKRAVQEMSESNEIPLAEGQGDVHDGHFDEPTVVIEEVESDAKDSPPPEFEIPENSVAIREEDNQRSTQWQPEQPQEVSKLRSTCFLHRIIKELENAEACHENVLTASASISGISQERIAAWEESEEKFIRTIEGSKCEGDEGEKFTENTPIVEKPLAITLIDNAPGGCIVGVEIEELNWRPTTPPPLPPSSRSISQFVEVEKISESTEREDIELGKTKSAKNKKSLGAKVRKFFRTAFKRGKDC